MEKRQLIAEIRKFNLSAPEAFLSQFQEADLERYLESLRADAAKRARSTGLADWDQPARLAS